MRRLIPLLFALFQFAPISTSSQLKLRNSRNPEDLMLLITTHLVSIKSQNYCTLLIWKNSKTQYSANLNNFSTRLIFQYHRPLLLFTNDSISLKKFPSKFQDPCSISLYLNLKNSKFPQKWQSMLPGSFSRSYHLIFHFHLEKENFQLVNLQPQFQTLVNRIFISFSFGSNIYCSLWTCDTFGLYCNSVSLTEAKQILVSDKINFNNRPLIWATVTLPQISQKLLDHFIKYRKHHNLFITPYVEVSERLNATPTLNMVKGQNFGILNKTTGKWNGAAGEVIYGRAHVSQGLITKDRAEALFLSKTIDSDGLTFLTGQETTGMGSALFLVNSFDWKIWTVMLASILGLMIIARFVKMKYFRFDGHMKISGILTVIISQLLEQPMETKKYIKFAAKPESRWAFGSWLLCLVVLGAVFKTNLISSLTSPNLDIPPKDFKSLLASDYKLSFLGVGLTAGVVFEQLKAKGSAVVRQLDQRIVSRVNIEHSEECISKTYGRHLACLGIKNTLKGPAIRYLTGENGQPLFRFGREYLYNTYYTFAISRKLPHLIGTLDKMMYHYSETGIYNHFRSVLYRGILKYGKMGAKQRGLEGKQFENEDEAPGAQKDSDISIILRSFIVLVFGFGAAIAFFAYEILKHLNSSYSLLFVVKKK